MEATDDSTVFAQPQINLFKAQGLVPISIEALQDEQNIAQEVGKLLAFGRDVLEAQAFVTGSGVGQPTGLITALTGVAASTVNSATAGTFALGDVYKMQGALPARYRPAASWLANNLVYNNIRQFDIYGGGGFWTNLNGDRPATLMNRDALEAEALSSTIATGQKILVIGDFDNYVIADRLGMTVEFIPHLFGTGSGRPKGQRGWFAYYRVGAGSVNNGAFRALNVA